MSSRMVSSWRSMSVWKKSASLNTNESALIVHGLDVFLERFGLLECASDGFVVGHFSFRGLDEFLVVGSFGLRLPFAPPW